MSGIALFSDDLLHANNIVLFPSSELHPEFRKLVELIPVVAQQDPRAIPLMVTLLPKLAQFNTEETELMMPFLEEQVLLKNYSGRETSTTEIQKKKL